MWPLVHAKGHRQLAHTAWKPLREVLCWIATYQNGADALGVRGEDVAHEESKPGPFTCKSIV